MTTKGYEQKDKCEVCGKTPLNGKDYFHMCRKCQPAYRLGFKQGLETIRGLVNETIEENSFGDK